MLRCWPPWSSKVAVGVPLPGHPCRDFILTDNPVFHPWSDMCLRGQPLQIRGR
jgi:hypothetical protein